MFSNIDEQKKWKWFNVREPNFFFKSCHEPLEKAVQEKKVDIE
jgi:hypothetical protein